LLTVTFFRPKPGHALLPGRLLCGELVVGEIGIPPGVVAPTTWVNDPEAWASLLPWPKVDGHKYARGHLLVAGGAELSGAARLAAEAGRRAGAGLVSLVAPEVALPVYRSGAPGCMALSAAQWPELLADPRKNAAVLGPGLGFGAATQRLVLDVLAADKACVLDADALTSFAEDPAALWAAFKAPPPGGEGLGWGDDAALSWRAAPASPTLDPSPQGGGKVKAVLTPHDGEFARLFTFQGDRLSRARRAAAESGAVVLLKGPDTVIAAPDGRAMITVNAPPSLATGGSGDVLAGIIGGLLAQGMPPFEAAAAAAWMHGQAANDHGPGLIAEDLIVALPAVWRRLAENDYAAWPGCPGTARQTIIDRCRGRSPWKT
jgi:NAD(P)H-hydrate epimerase